MLKPLASLICLLALVVNETTAGDAFIKFDVSRTGEPSFANLPCFPGKHLDIESSAFNSFTPLEKGCERKDDTARLRSECNGRNPCKVLPALPAEAPECNGWMYEISYSCVWPRESPVSADPPVDREVEK